MAMPVMPPPGFDELSPAEKLDYIHALWDRLAAHPQDVPVPEWQREVVAERLAAHEAGEGSTRPWSEARQELLAKLRDVRR